jgi:hypothetical protein
MLFWNIKATNCHVSFLYPWRYDNAIIFIPSILIAVMLCCRLGGYSLQNVLHVACCQDLRQACLGTTDGCSSCRLSSSSSSTISRPASTATRVWLRQLDGLVNVGDREVDLEEMHNSPANQDHVERCSLVGGEMTRVAPMPHTLLGLSAALTDSQEGHPCPV